MMKNRVLYFDVLNVISCISVVCMHSNGYVHSFAKDEWWWLRVLVEVVCYFAVPVFFMLSGATLMNYRERYTTKEFLKKRFQRTVVPYLFWGIAFYTLYLLNNGVSSLQWSEVIERFLTGHIPYTNYWFFIPLFLLYVFIPFIALMVNNMSLKHVGYLCIILIFFQSVFPTINSLIGIDFEMSLPIGSYVVYMLLGYYISCTDIEKSNKGVLIICFIAIISMIIRYWLLYNSDEKIPYLFTYFGLFAIFPAIAVFMLVKRLVCNSAELHSFWTFLSSKSLGVYLVHTFLIVIFAKVMSRENPWFILLATVLIYTISVVIVLIMQKNSFVKKNLLP